MGEDLKSRDDLGRSRRPVFIWVFCFFGALAAAATIILLLSGRNWKPIEQTLSDGSILRIEAVTFGTNHVFSKHPVREKIRGVLPDRLKPLLGKGNFTARMQTVPNSLVLWTTRLDATGRAKNLFPAVLTRPSTFPRDERHYATDVHGCRFLANYRSGSTVAGNAVMGVAFDGYPRRAKQLDYVVCDNSDNVIGKLSVPNPFAAMPASKPWLPEKMPITKTNGGLVAELRKLRRLSSSGRILPETRLVRLTDVELWEKGPSWISDSSGNRTLFGALCTNEPAWKIETEFFRNVRAEFRPDETWVITNVAVPRPGESIVLHKTNMLQGCVVAVTSLQGFALSEPDTSTEVRRDPPGADTAELSVEPPTLHVWSTHWNNEIRILIRARDDSGRKLVTRAHEERSMGYSRHATQRQQSFDVHLFPDSKSLEIEVLVQKPAKFEFFVEPSQATDRSSQW